MGTISYKNVKEHPPVLLFGRLVRCSAYEALSQDYPTLFDLMAIYMKDKEHCENKAELTLELENSLNSVSLKFGRALCAQVLV